MDSQFVLGVEPGVRCVTERFGLSPAPASPTPTAQEMIDAVIFAVDDFRRDRDLQDDLTLVAVQHQSARATTEPLAAAV